MNYRKRLFSALAALVLLAALIGISILSGGETGQSSGSLFSRKTTLDLWYTDANLTDYLRDTAVAFNRTDSRYRVEPRLIDDADYFEKIYRASTGDEEFPDLYIITNDSLERAAMAGLTSEVEDVNHFEDGITYPGPALDAVSYKGKYIAYPLSYETAAFLYNKEYLQQMADTAGKSLEETVPHSMLDVIRLANSFNAPEQVTDVFKWDVGDIFYNYYFVGNYINMGGPCGDDHDDILIYSENAIQCLKVYQQLNTYFSVDAENDDYGSVIDDFAAGRIVFTVATSDAVRTIRDKVASGASQVDYGVVRIPELTQDLLTKTMSVTQCIAVNGYSEEQEAAHRFARYMLYSHIGRFYELTGKPCAQRTYPYEDRHMNGFMEAYEDSIPITKLRECSNFWLLLETAFSRIWRGADANETLRELTEQMFVQISGTDIEVPKLEDPEPVDIAAELTGGD